jgi:hypothetical protein
MGWGLDPAKHEHRQFVEFSPDAVFGGYNRGMD